jgi:tRNA-modifying protein YgfZ
MTDGYQALRETAAKIDLTARGRIRVTGEDRARLIHAMTTNHVKDLVPGTGCYAFFLNAVGRILADASILCFEEHLLLDTEPESRSFLMEHLDKYIIADDVVLEDATDSTFELGIEGPNAESALEGSGLPVPGSQMGHLSTGKLTVVRATSTGEPGFRILGPVGSAPALEGLASATADEVKMVRLEHFYPRYGDDITVANLPQETGLSDGLHFNKGCYLGQEIVERVRSRGHVNRMLVGLKVEGSSALEKGAKVSFEGTEVGEVTSSAYSPAVQATLAMAYVRVNAGKPGTEVLVEGRKAQTAAIKSSRT